MRKCTWKETKEGKTVQKFGYFHQFGLNCASDQDGRGAQWTEAIVEDKDGNIEQLTPHDIQFVSNGLDTKDFEEHMQKFGF